MSSYEDMHYYRGDIYIRDSSSIDRLVEQGALLQYNANDNTFLWEEKGMIYVAKLFDAAIENNEEMKKEYEKEMNKYIISTNIPSIAGVYYIKEDTLVEDKSATRYVNFELIRKFDESFERPKGRK